MSWPLQVRDARGQPITLSRPPRRVVSLVPSTTETVFALGQGHRLVGLTRYCVHPAQARASLPRVGGTKDLELDALLALQPDLVLANAEENTREIFAQLQGRVPLYVAFPRTVDEALADLLLLGAILDAAGTAARLVGRIRAARARARRAACPMDAACFCWWRPAMVASADTFVAAMLGELGLRLLPASGPRYPQVEPEDLRSARRLLLMSEPYPFQERHRPLVAAWAGRQVDEVLCVDGEHCTWHGARMLEAFRAFPALARALSATPAPSSRPG